MTSRSYGNSVLLLRPLAVVLTRLGADGARFLVEVGVDAATGPEAYVPTTRVDRALQSIATERGDETFGLTMAHEAVVRPLGLFSHLVWLSGTLRDALTRAARFYSVVTQRSTLTLESVEEGRVAAFTQRLLAGAERGDILTDFAFGSLVLRARAATDGRFRPRGMRFAHGARVSARYEALFEAPVSFDAPADELTLDASQLDLPLASADPVTAAAIEVQVRQFDAKGGASRPFGEHVRAAVRVELQSGQPSLVTVARQLGMGVRALRRRLDEDGLSLRAVVESVRHDRATDLLAAGASIKEVAFLLGFSEPSAFSRAYKRWTGRPPSDGSR
jgi:AraC-like DNA-binding protein